ncbi:MAG: regulatory iron-sulfur-containing complex subunit RicT, partial [Dehalococcoidales bacterium]
MSEIVGVRFKTAGKIYYFDPTDIELQVGDDVIVETIRGLEVGRIVTSPREAEASDVARPLKPVVRMAEPEEIDHAAKFEAKERKAVRDASRLVAELGLPMKILSAEYSLDGKHVTLFFSSEERVDFRDLVRDLAGRFRARVELRQIGARDEAKLIGGFGRCGRQLCCASFLSDFTPISIRMAKEQNLPLNPMKISGVCGRLLCCLSYENEQYRDMKRQMPKGGQHVETAMGPARVINSNPLKETVFIELENRVRVEVPLAEIGGAAKAPGSAENKAPEEAPAKAPEKAPDKTPAKAPEGAQSRPSQRSGRRRRR